MDSMLDTSVQIRHNACMITFKEYVHRIGTRRMSELYGVSQRTVRSWIGEGKWKRYPRPDKARKIVADSNGALTLAAIYRED